MDPAPIVIAKTVVRGAAFDDLAVTLFAARVGIRLLWFTARDQTEREVAKAAGQAMDHAMGLVRLLRRPAPAEPASPPAPEGEQGTGGEARR